MASIIFGGGIVAAVGSHSGNTFARNRGGAYMKKKSMGTNPRSSTQLRHRTRIGYLSKYWSFTLTDSDRSAWNTFAAVQPVINRLGNTTFLSGQQMFCKLNAVVDAAGSAIATSPPVSTAVGTPISILTSAIAGGGGSVTTIVNTASGVNTQWANVWVSPPLNPGRSFVSSQLRKLPNAVHTDTFANITTQYLALYGLLPTAAGQRLFVRARVFDPTTGVSSSFIQSSTLWA